MFKEVVIWILAILAVLAIWALTIGFYTLVFWGLGSLITTVFSIGFYWTAIHGLCVALIFWVLKGLFSRG